MANINAPFGAVPHKHGSGGVGSRTNEYDIASGLAADIYEGDWVKTAADGTLAKAVAGDQVLGVFQGVRFTAATGEVKYANRWATGTLTLGAQPAKALVFDDPNQHFKMQVATAALSDNGSFANLVIPGSPGDNATGKSRASLITGGAETQFQIVRVLPFACCASRPGPTLVTALPVRVRSRSSRCGQ
jgi:hypothetical protein